jgi:hypothetical protein
MERFRMEPKEVDIQALVGRVCGKSKPARPTNIDKATGGKKGDRRSETDYLPGKGVACGATPVPNLPGVGGKRTSDGSVDGD